MSIEKRTRNYISDSSPAKVGSTLRSQRIKSGLPQWKFASKFGLNPGTYPAWEQGKSVPDVDQAVGLIRALGYDGLKELGHDLGELLDALRGDGIEGKREAHHWIDEIYKHCDNKTCAEINGMLRNIGGKCGGK